MLRRQERGEAMDSEWVTASELGDWAYCRRAWWHARRGAARDAAPHLDAGMAAHATFARQVTQVERRRGLGLGLIAASSALALLLAILLLVLL
jgi:hypothetical protein